jgi:hypothetical protein
MIHESAARSLRTSMDTRGTGSGNTEMEKARVDRTIAYCKPSIVILGSVAEMIRGTHIKGHRGIIEAIHWRILPAYDLDE